jgi:hypothetical protein
MKENIISRISIILSFTLIIRVYNQTISDKDCPNNLLKCKDSGICVDNYNKCPTPMNCGLELKKINQYTCSKINSFSENINCNGYTCWNNQCVENANDCPTMISCPPGFQKCHDNSCVIDLDQCPKYIICPKFIPIRCPNGDCRRSLEDCPSLIKCPKNRPILCNDNSCKASLNECLFSSKNTKCNGTSMVRCSDGSCKYSKFLCSTLKTCPKNKVLCHFGICANSFSQCEELEEKYNFSSSNGSIDKVRCQDGSYQDDINNCPSEIICPVEKPVRCWDNSCKENINQCPPYQNCPENSYDCSNGTCSIDANCGTLITCSWEASFKCNDNTCRRNPKDCINNFNCPLELPILCWDGSCVKNRYDCFKPSNCESSTSVKCPDNSCRRNVEECREIEGCPLGFIRCPDSSCKRKSTDCGEIKCPNNFPNLCKNGICVKNKKECELENSCPAYSPIKCKKSSKCVSDNEKCEDQKQIQKGKQICPDGSILDEGLNCPFENGCFLKDQTLCANNICEKNCDISTCPKETPIKCLSGLCTNTLSNCPSNYDFNRYEHCKELNMISCHNGQCAKYQEECKPTSSCSQDKFLCKNGTCKNNINECPIETTCPKNFSFRCPNGTCEKSEDECLNISGCPRNKPVKCFTNGYCVSNQQECKAYDKKFPMGNGCDNYRPYKCLSGKCAYDKNDCKEEFCEPHKFFCPNSGVCESSKDNCKDSKCNKITCPLTGYCVEDYGECIAASNCNLKTPNRCLDGNCRKYPFLFNSENESLFCSSGIECPSYRPYLCADGSCEEKSTFCKSLNECPSDKKIRCPDRTCASRYEDCKLKNACPETNPILCNNSGNCVKNYFDCFDEKCPDLLPIKCISGICVSTPRECVYKLTPIGSTLEKFVQITGCTGSQETCFDGSCRNKIEECPIFNGCNNLKYPFKCKNGKCAKSEKGCFKDIYNKKINFRELLELDCKENPGTQLCDDGICRKKCPIMNSCNNENPYLCTNGVCVLNIFECAGESKCKLGQPFKCADSTCKKNPSDCYMPKKLEPSVDLNIFVYPQNHLLSDIVVDEYNNVITSLKIPSNTFVENKNNSTIPSKQIISIKSIPTTFPYFTNTVKSFNDDVRDFILKLFPYGDEKDKNELEFRYSIVSSILSIEYQNKNLEIQQNIILKMSYDLSSVEEIGNITNRVCLAYLPKQNSTKWECKPSIKEDNKLEENTFSGIVNDEGYYAIAVDIKYIQEEKTEISKVYKYFKWIFLSALLALALISILIYILGRVWRYRQKYKLTRQLFIEMEKKESVLREKTTSFKGESMKDAEQNMVFTDNTCKIEKIGGDEKEKNDRNQNLETLEDSYFLKIKKLEANNEKLGIERDNLLDRLEKLKEYQNLVAKRKNLLTDESY